MQAQAVRRKLKTRPTVTVIEIPAVMRVRDWLAIFGITERQFKVWRQRGYAPLPDGKIKDKGKSVPTWKGEAVKIWLESQMP
jgi:hypothetical protein